MNKTFCKNEKLIWFFVLVQIAVITTILFSMLKHLNAEEMILYSEEKQNMTVTLERGSYLLATEYASTVAEETGVISLSTVTGDLETAHKALMSGTMSLEGSGTEAEMDFRINKKSQTVEVLLTVPASMRVTSITLEPNLEMHLQYLATFVFLFGLADYYLFYGKRNMKRKWWIPLVIGLTASTALLVDYVGGAEAIEWISQIELWRENEPGKIFAPTILLGTVFRLLGFMPGTSLQMGILFWNLLWSVILYGVFHSVWKNDLLAAIGIAVCVMAPWRLRLLYWEGSMRIPWLYVLTTIVLSLLICRIIKYKKISDRYQWIILVGIVLCALYIENKYMVTQDILWRVYSGKNALIHLMS